MHVCVVKQQNKVRSQWRQYVEALTVDKMVWKTVKEWDKVRKISTEDR